MGKDDMNETQWNEFKLEFKELDGKIEDIKTSITELHLGMTFLGNELGIKVKGDEIGKSTGNGIKKEIDVLKNKTGNAIKTWLPVIACAIMLFFSIYTWTSTSIQKDIQIQQLQQQLNPAPTP